MKEVRGDAWNLSVYQSLCILTNGNVDSRGRAVMGAGIAKQCKDRFPEFPKALGARMGLGGSTNVYEMGVWKRLTGHLWWHLISFPTKVNWKERADLELICDSAEALREIVLSYMRDAGMRFYLPRPGCGLGGLSWEREVKPKIEEILGDLDNLYIVEY